MSILTPKTAGYVNLSYCVARVQADREDYSDRLTEKATQHAINCFTFLNVMGKHSIEVDYPIMDANGIVDLTGYPDFIDYIKIGIPDQSGKIWLLSKNDKIIQVRDELDATLAAQVFSGTSSYIPSYGYYFADHYVDGVLRTGWFGLGGGFNRSFFRVDMEKNQIQFDTAVPNGQIIMEYSSTGIKATGATTIPRTLVDYIVACIHWQLKLHDPRVDRFERGEFKQNFLEQENMLTAYKYRFDPNEYMAMRYENVKQSPKR